MSNTFTTLRRVVVALALVALLGAPAFAQDDKKAECQDIRGIVYKTVGDREIKLNLFIPLNDNNEMIKGEPLLIWLDSGCWYSGDPGDGGYWRATGALKKGFAIASVSHRPINEAAFPAAIEDVRAAVRFLRKHAADYGYDPERIAVSGASSGGNLSLTLGISDDASIFDVGDNLDVSGQVQRVVDFYGPSDFEIVFKRYAKQALDCIYIAVGYPREAADPENEQYPKLIEDAKKFSPITYVDEKYAPTIIFQGTDDPLFLLSQSALMYEALKVAGVRAQLSVTDGGVHDIGTLGSPNFLTREIYEFLGW